MTDAISTAARDYSITGDEKARALSAGLGDGRWWMPDIAPERLRQLMRRSNARAARDAVLWIALLIGSAVLAWRSLGSWWSIPAFAVYGALYGGSSDARWHEFGHGTAFRSALLNEALYYPACFMLAREPTLWRWSHFRHHTDTIIRGRDAEIAFERPASFARTAWQFTHIQGGSTLMWTTVRHVFGRIDDSTRELVPPDALPRLVREARIFTAIWAAAVAGSLAARSIVPVLFIGGPTIYGAWLVVFFGITQHAGLRENVLDHRYSTRTVYMNPVFRFLYLNMNYHVEHHLFPAVPYHALPALHAEIKDQLAPAHPNTPSAYREIFTAFRHQRLDPDWELPDRGVPDVPGHRARVVQVLERPGAIATPHGDRIDLGEADLDEGGLRAIDIAGRAYVLARIQGGDYVLADRTCTHGEADLSTGLVLGCELECPKHNGRFDLRTGEPTRRPVREALGVRPVQLSAGRLSVDLRSPERGGPGPNEADDADRPDGAGGAVFYHDLAGWWHLISPVEDYRDEAGYFVSLLSDGGAPSTRRRTLLELGSGGGNNAFFLASSFELTLVDRSEAMLDMSRRLNPTAEHVCGDMRNVRLDRTFDVVFVHDAIDYMTTETDLRAALETAYVHLRPGGTALLVPDHTVEKFEPGTDTGGSDGSDGRSLRYLEWTVEPQTGDPVVTTHYAFVLRHADGRVELAHETHRTGLFPRSTWLRLLGDVGFEATMIEEITDDDRTPRDVFVARRPATRTVTR